MEGAVAVGCHRSRLSVGPSERLDVGLGRPDTGGIVVALHGRQCGGAFASMPSVRKYVTSGPFLVDGSV